MLPRLTGVGGGSNKLPRGRMWSQGLRVASGSRVAVGLQIALWVCRWSWGQGLASLGHG
jgi:hypothetical protein